MEISWRFSAKPRRGHSRHISQLQLNWSPATFCHIWVERSRAVFMQLHGSRSCADEAGSWSSTWRSHAIWTDQRVGIFWWWMICHRIMALRWRINESLTLWRSVMMTFRELTELQEKSRNAAHKSAIMHMVEKNGWSQLDHSQRWITAREGLRPEMDARRWIPARYASQPDMDRDQIWINDRRWIIGDWTKEMDHRRQMAIHPLPCYEDIAVMWRYTLLEITYFDFNLQSYNRAQIWRHTVYRRHVSTEYDTEHYSDQYSAIPNYAATCPSSHAEYNPDSASVISSHTATMPIMNIMKPYDISLWRSNYHSRRGWQCQNHNNLYQEQLPYRKCRNKAPWTTFTNREGQQRHLHAGKWWQTHLQIDQEAACPSYNPEWNPDSISAIPTQSWQFQDTQLLLEINFRIKPN